MQFSPLYSVHYHIFFTNYICLFSMYEHFFDRLKTEWEYTHSCGIHNYLAEMEFHTSMESKFFGVISTTAVLVGLGTSNKISIYYLCITHIDGFIIRQNRRELWVLERLSVSCFGRSILSCNWQNGLHTKPTLQEFNL